MSSIHKTSRAACINCHCRKIRCDAHKRGFPCSNCISSNRPNCRIHEKKKRSDARLSNRFVAIKTRTEHVTDELNSSPIVCTRTSNLSTSIPSRSLQPSKETDETGRRHLVEFIDQKDIGHRSIQQGVRITYLGKDVSNINFLVRQRDGGENETVYHFPSDQIARQFTTHEPERIPQEAFNLPDQALADELVEAYFTHINPGCPVVDEEIFMWQYRGRDASNPPSLLILQAILMVGAHVSRGCPDRDSLKATFFRRAKMLFDARLEKNRDVVVQAALLLTWHSDGAEDIAANAWYWVGIAARTAMGLGMHRDAGASTLVHHDMRTWRRTWWILVQFDVTISLSYGRPQAINLDECDVLPLTSSDFEGCGPRVQIDYVIKYTELCLLISKVMRERFGLRVSLEDRKAALGTADEALANWCLMLPSHLQMRTADLSIWAASLHLTYNNFLILLHRPHPRAKQRSDHHGPNDADICTAAANAIASIFEELRQKNNIKYLWIADINALFTAMIQVSVELRFSNPVLAINALRRFDSTLFSLRKLAEYWINAESILRLFEESSHVQHGIRLRKEPNASQECPPTACPVSLNQTLDQSSGSNSDMLPNAAWNAEDRTDLDVLAAAAAASGQNSAVDSNLVSNPNSWIDSFPQIVGSPEHLGIGSDTMPLESEWREIYWQEPGISGTFTDGFWGWS